MKKNSLKLSRIAGLGKYIILITWSFIVIVPIWTMIINSMKPKMHIYMDPFGFPKEWTFDGYTAIFKDSSFLVYFQNSIFITTISILLILIVGALAAYAITRWDSKFARFSYIFFLAGMMIPIRIGSINLLQIIKSLGLMDNLLGLLPIYIAMGLPLAVFVLTEFIKEVPVELIDAAHIDGASNSKIFWIIILPLTRPAMATVAIFNLVTIWNDLWFPLIFIRSESQRTLMLGVTRLFGQYQTDWTKIFSTLTLSAVPIIILYLLMAKQFIKGLTAGAIKG